MGKIVKSFIASLKPKAFILNAIFRFETSFQDLRTGRFGITFLFKILGGLGARRFNITFLSRAYFKGLRTR